MFRNIEIGTIGILVVFTLVAIFLIYRIVTKDNSRMEIFYSLFVALIFSTLLGVLLGVQGMLLKYSLGHPLAASRNLFGLNNEIWGATRSSFYGSICMAVVLLLWCWHKCIGTETRAPTIYRNLFDIGVVVAGIVWSAIIIYKIWTH